MCPRNIYFLNVAMNLVVVSADIFCSLNVFHLHYIIHRGLAF